jgi:hypothetical protein
MKRQTDTQPKESELLRRLESLEIEVKHLASLRTDHVARVLPLLIGWGEISAYCRKKPRTLSRYAKDKAFPAYRWGRHVVSSPHSVDGWLRAVQELRRKKKNELHAS